jgi:hypothetical protein
MLQGIRLEGVQRQNAFSHRVIDDLAVLDAEHTQGGCAFVSTRGWDPEEFPPLRAAERPLHRDSVAFRNQCLDFDSTVGEGRRDLGTRLLDALRSGEPSRGHADDGVWSNQLIYGL